MLECRTFLNEVVAQEREVTTLGKDRGFVVDRAILEVEYQPTTR